MRRRTLLAAMAGSSIASPLLSGCGGGGSGGTSSASTSSGTSTGPSSRVTFDVRAFGARGDGAANDRAAIAAAIRAATAQPGCDLVFPAGDYWLGPIDTGTAITVSNADDMRILGAGATLRCRTTRGIAQILLFQASRRVSIAGLGFVDDGLDREVTWQGAEAIYLSGDQSIGCSDFSISNCRFRSVLSALTAGGGRSEVAGIALDGMDIEASYYGLNFQNNGNRVRARDVVCRDVRRSYFPYGVDDHDIALVSSGNATGSTDVLIKCYGKPTTNLSIRATSDAKHGGDGIVSFEHEGAAGAGIISGISVAIDVSAADCSLTNVFVFQSFDAAGEIEARTACRWSDITLDGRFQFCDRETTFVRARSAPATAANVRYGAGLAPWLPAVAPTGFVFEPLR